MVEPPRGSALKKASRISAPVMLSSSVPPMPSTSDWKVGTSLDGLSARRRIWRPDWTASRTCGSANSATICWAAGGRVHQRDGGFARDPQHARRRGHRVGSGENEQVELFHAPWLRARP
ncbi:hypothetical protein [Brevundimonas sp.]|uniref:hypothetical protein n=1 Tax=Brevundimonas sp. TaxID=1871086 RepID=UPI003F6F533B